jgi:hypothetical protein
MSRWEFRRTNLCGRSSGSSPYVARTRPRSGVLDRAWHVDQAFLFPAPWRGAALACGRRALDICFSAESYQKCRTRRLPGITQGDDLSNAPTRLHPAHRAANRSVVPGSRLFSYVSAGLVLRRNSRGRKDTRQSSSPPGAGQSRVASTHHVI